MMDEPENLKRSQEQIERWMNKSRPAWREGYDFLMATKAGIRYYDALLAVWLSVGKDDRGALETRDDFARFIGVSRAVTYQWQDRRPEILVWAREIVEHRFDNSKIAAVDGRVIQKATARSTTVPWVRLFYERAGLLKSEGKLHLVGGDKGDEPLGIQVIGDYRAAIAGLAPRPMGDRDAPGADQDIGDGTPVG